LRDRRPRQEVCGLNAKSAGKPVNHVDAGGIDAALKGTDVSAIDLGAMGKFLLRQTAQPPTLSVG
jgi:hypothetical protein